jgi:hypothetical protein
MPRKFSNENRAYDAFNVSEDCITGSRTNRRHGDLSWRVRTSKVSASITKITPQFSLFGFPK